MKNNFTEYDVSLHLVNIDLVSGVVDAEVCVRDDTHTGLCDTALILGNPASLLEDIKKATQDLLDQRGPFQVRPDEKQDLYYLYFKKKVISSWSEESSAEAARVRLNKIWRSEHEDISRRETSDAQTQ